MANFCTKCGAKLPENAKFCDICGAKVKEAAAPAPAPVTPPPAEPKETVVPAKPAKAAKPAGTEKPAGKRSAGKPASPKPEVQKIILPKVAAPTIREKKPAPASAPAKKSGSGGLLDKILTVTLAILVGISAFKYPGFLIPHKQEPAYGGSGQTPVVNDTLSDKAESFQEVSFHSDPVDITPVEGIRITCEKDQLYEDTKLTMTTIADNDERVMGISQDLQAQGIYALGAWEFDGGLEADDCFPGEYQMSFDLAKLGIPEELWDGIRVYRIDDSNELTEYGGQLSGNSYQITGNRNSVTILGVALFAGFMAVAIPLASWVGEDIRAHWYYSWGDGKVDRDNEYGKFRVRFKLKDVDTDQSDILEQISEIEDRCRKKAEEDFNAEEEVRNQSRGSLWLWYNENKSVALRLKEYLAKDAEYQRLIKEVELPAVVQEIVRSIETAYQYLGKHERIRIPKNRVEFMIKKLEGENPNLGEAVSHWIHSTYIHIDMRDPEGFVADTNAGKVRRDNLLLTVTHELFHICQDEYHFKNFGTSIRYDEMVTLVLESDAKEYFKEEGIITTDPALTGTGYWMTMFTSADVIKGENEFQQRQGYLLSTLAQFLRQKTGNNVSPLRMMNARSSFKTPLTSQVLMAAFGLSEKQFDQYFREWAVSDPRGIQGSIGYYYDEMRAVYPAGSLSGDQGIHVPLKSEDSYVIGFREFFQDKDEKAALLILFDEKKNSARRDMSLVPYGKYDQVDGGYFVYAQNRILAKGASKNRRMLEVYGKLDSKTKYNGSSGYTIYTMYAPAKPTLSEREDKLVIQLPHPVGAAGAGVLDGLIMSVKATNGYEKVFDIESDRFGQELLISTSEIRKAGDADDISVSITIQEYKKAFRGGYNLFGPESEPAVIQLADDSSKDAVTYSGLRLKSDSLVGFTMSEPEDTDESHYTYDPWPTNNSIRIQGDKVTVSIGGLNYNLRIQDKQYKEIYLSETFTRDAYTVTGKVKYRDDNSISCELTDITPRIKGSVTANGMDAEFGGYEILDWLPINYNQTIEFYEPDLEYDSLVLTSSALNIALENGNMTSAKLSVSGTLKTDKHGSYDGEVVDNAGEQAFTMRIELLN